MATAPAYFEQSDGGAFAPTRFALSHWGNDQLNGPAIVGLCARALENHCGAEEFLPSRLTVDLFKAARRIETTLEVRTVREGRRVRNAECDVLQEGRAVAHALLVQYRRSAPPPGQVWQAQAALPTLPPPDDEIVPFVGSDDGGWTRSPAAHQNTSRKRFFNNGINVVAGERTSPFVRAAMVAESTSLVTNLGSEGIGYINGDLTVGLARLPVDDWVCVQGDAQWASAGIAVGTATLFDHLGAFGSGMVTAVANPAAQIDFSSRPFPIQELNYE